MRWYGVLLVAVLSVVMGLPFLDQAFHVDDSNFLALAAHAYPDPLHLYDFEINWGGTQERAFDILANPPLVPWYLAMVSRFAGGAEWAYHLAFFPFYFLALLGAAKLGSRFAPGRWPGWTALAAGAAPAVVLASHTVMPDIPMLMCYLWGVYLGVTAIDDKRYGKGTVGGLIAGLSALFRYSGVTVIPLLGLYGVLNRRRSRGVPIAVVTAAVVPILMWSMVSWKVYGQVHLLAIAGFETQSVGGMDLVHKFGYQFVSVGLSVAVASSWIVLGKRGNWQRGWGIAGALAALSAGLLTRIPPVSTFLLVVGAGGCGVVVAEVLKGLMRGTKRRVWSGRVTADSDWLFLSLWVLGVVVFNAWLLFASVRYLLPLALPVVLLVERRLAMSQVSNLATGGAILMAALLSLGLSSADEAFANGYRDVATSLSPIHGHRWFVGHWGLQYYLERSGARALGPEDWGEVDVGDEIIVPRYSWPQDLPDGIVTHVVQTKEIAYPTGFRTFSVKGRACFYSNWLAPGPIRVWLPYTVASGPLETIQRLEVIDRVEAR